MSKVRLLHADNEHGVHVFLGPFYNSSASMRGASAMRPVTAGLCYLEKRQPGAIAILCERYRVDQ